MRHVDRTGTVTSSEQGWCVGSRRSERAAVSLPHPAPTWRGCPSVNRYRPQAICGSAMAASDSRSANAAAH